MEFRDPDPIDESRVRYHQTVASIGFISILVGIAALIQLMAGSAEAAVPPPTPQPESEPQQVLQQCVGDGPATVPGAVVPDVVA